MKRFKAVAVIVGLLALVAIFNYALNMDPAQLAARGVGGGGHDHGGDHDEAEHEGEAVEPEAPGPLGVEGAAVTIDVFYGTDETYREMLEAMMVGLVAAYEPHVRVEPRSLEDAENFARCRELPLRGQAGLAVNGRVIHEIAGAGSFGMVALKGTPDERNWHEGLLRQVIDHELKSKGIEFTAPDPPAQAPAAEHQHEHEH